jgi:hypothetical protein
MRFRHATGEHVAGVTIDRKPVQAGAIRFAHGAPETHAVEYLGDATTESVRIEFRTEPLDRPIRHVRLPPVALDPSRSEMQAQFENGQVRIYCEWRVPRTSAVRTPGIPADPAVTVAMSGSHRGDVEWSPPPETGPLEQIRIELKSKPMNNARP